MRLAIIGANGFLGKHLTRFCLRLGHTVTAIILPNTVIDGLEGAEIVFARSLDIGTFTSIFRNVQVVINAAGNMLGVEPSRYQSANVDLVESICRALEAIVSPPRLIHLSTVAVTGPTDPEHLLDETASCHPVSIYGRSKLQGERCLFGRKGRFPFIIIRSCSLYGPGDPNFFGLFRLARLGFFARFFTEYKQFQLTFIEDFLRIFQKILAHPFPVPLIHVGNPVPTSDQDLMDALAAAAGRPLRSLFFPASLTRLIGRSCDILEILTGSPTLLSTNKFVELAQPCWLHDMTRQETFFSCAPYLALTEGIQRTWRWYSLHQWL